jgi:plasmid stabilization system protein ParE
VSRYSFHPEASVDLDEVWAFIAADNLAAADKVVGKIRADLATAALSPRMGHLRPKLNRRGLRFLSVYEYLIAYAPDKKPLWVIAIVHGRRSPRTIRAILEGRQ